MREACNSTHPSTSTTSTAPTVPPPPLSLLRAVVRLVVRVRVARLAQQRKRRFESPTAMMTASPAGQHTYSVTESARESAVGVSAN